MLKARVEQVYWNGRPALLVHGSSHRLSKGETEIFISCVGRGWLHQTGLWQKDERAPVRAEVGELRGEALLRLPDSLATRLAVGLPVTIEVPAIDFGAELLCRASTSWPTEFSPECAVVSQRQAKEDASLRRSSWKPPLEANASADTSLVIRFIPSRLSHWWRQKGGVGATIALTLTGVIALAYWVLPSGIFAGISSTANLDTKPQIASCSQLLKASDWSMAREIRRANADSDLDAASEQHRLFLTQHAPQSDNARQHILNLFARAVCWNREEFSQKAAEYFERGPGRTDHQAAWLADYFRSQR